MNPAPQAASAPPAAHPGAAAPAACPGAAAPAAAARPAPSPQTAALLRGPVLPLLLKLSLPNMAAMLASALASIFETRYAGLLGRDALAAMALAFPLVMLQQMLSAGAMGGGVSSAISRALGAGQPARASALALHALGIAVCGGALIWALMAAGGRWLFGLLGGSGPVLALALDYSAVAFTGSIFVWLVNTLASILRGTGQMALPSGALLAIAVAQVLLAGALGLGFGPVPALGLPGVAAGQVVAYGLGAVGLLGWLASGRAGLVVDWRGTRLQGALLRDILKVGAVACASPLQTVLTILILTHLVAQFGVEALAGYGIGARLEFLLVPIAFAVGVASVPLVGVAIGAGQVARARQVAWTAAAIATVALGLIGAVVALWPQLWVRLFTQDAAVLASAARYFQFAGPCYALFGLGLSLYFSSMGSGKVAGPVLAGTLRLLVVALGGLLLVRWQAPAWGVFALVAAGMAAYGIATALVVRATAW